MQSGEQLIDLPPDVRELAAVIDGYLDALAQDPTWQWDASDGLLRVAYRLGQDAQHQFDRLARPLRAYMRAVPTEDRLRLELPDVVWERLLGHDFMAEWESAKQRHIPDESEPAFGSDPADDEGLLLVYAVAAGELALKPLA